MNSVPDFETLAIKLKWEGTVEQIAEVLEQVFGQGLALGRFESHPSHPE
jgi:hypothetical protein